MSRLPRRILLGIALALALALAVGVSQRRSIARSLLEAELRARGVAVIESEVEHVGLTELRVRNLRLGDAGDLVVDAIAARYSLTGLADGRLDALSLQGVRLRGSLGEGGLSFGAVDGLLRGSEAHASPPAVPATVVRLDDVTVELDTARGRVDLGLSGQLEQQAEDRVELRTRIHGRGALDPGGGAASAPVDLDLELDANGELRFSGAMLAFDISATSSDAALALRTSGSHDVASGRGDARLVLAPVELRAATRLTDVLIALVGRPFAIISGSLQVQGASRWGGETPPSASLDVTLRDLGVASEQGSFEHLGADIHLDGPWPAATPPAQLVTVSRIDLGLELTNVRVSFQLRPDGGVDISAAECSFAGGRVRTRDPFDVSAPTQKLVLELTDVELATLLTLVDVDGLTGSGKLSGRIPLSRRGETLEIHQGRLEATAPGWVRYASRAGTAGVSGQAQGFDVALAVLSNLQYETLVATLDGDLAGSIPISVHLVGANPDYQGGRPVDFTLTVDSHLADLIRDVRAAYRIPEEIERRVERGFEKRR